MHHRRDRRPSVRRGNALVSEALEPRRLLAAVPYDGLVAPYDVAASTAAPLGGQAYFFARDGGSSTTRLYRTDGTPAGTVPTGVELPVVGSSDPTALVPLGGQILFVLPDAVGGPDLWATDGTPAGTRVVYAFDNPTDRPESLMPVGDQVFFTVDDSATGKELWRTDGTAAGTRLVKDIRPGPDSAAIDARVPSGGRLYFVANDGVHGAELWSSDGTEAGTALVADLVPGIGGSSISDLYADPDTGLVFFAAAGRYPAAAGREPYVTDGTAAGTRLLKDVRPGGDSAPQGFVRFGDRVWFAANDGTRGRELWTTDGTEAGTQLAFERWPGTSGFAGSGAFVVGDRLLFTGVDGQGASLWATDGTAAGTAEITTPQGPVINPRFIGSLGDRAYFAFQPLFGGPAAVGDELWATDGTTAGTTLLRDIAPGLDSSLPRPFGRVGDRLLFRASDIVHGAAPWATDGTPGGTVQIRQHAGDGAPVEPQRLVAAGDRLYVFGRYASPHLGTLNALWATDSAPGSAPARPLAFGLQPDDSGDFVETTAGGRFYFGGPRGVWTSDGTPQGTVRLHARRVASGNSGTLPAHFQTAVVGESLYFVTRPDTRTHELWKSDGTPQGTVRVTQVRGGTRSDGFIQRLTPVGDRVVFSAIDDEHGAELWVSDGTEQGTGLLIELVPGFNGPPIGATYGGSGSLSDVMYFVADDGTHGNALWRTDGTAEGTRFVADLMPGRPIFEFYLLPAPSWRAVGDVMYFMFPSDLRPGFAPSMSVWRTDGTAAGTRVVEDETVRWTSGLSVYDGEPYFAAATEGGSGVSLYRVDAATGQPVLVRSIPDASGSGRLVDGPDGVYFHVVTPAGADLWVSDGTADGTRALAHVSDARNYLGFWELAATGDAAWFIDEQRLWVTPEPATRPPAAVVGRHVFYSGSPSAAAGADATPAAVAPDKAPLLPGQTASFANVTSYNRGLNGVVLDVARGRAAPGVDDFTFEVGDGGGRWAPAPTPSGLAYHRRAGADDSDRVVISWPDGAIRNTWLRVTVRPTARTGLAAADVFSFGNLVGETDGVPGPDGRLRVNALDVAALKRGLTTAAVGLDNPYDVNRDGRVNALDLAAVKASLTRTLGLPPAPSAAAALAAPSITEDLFGSVA